MKKERLESLDVMRGFDMFWIIGGGALITSLATVEWLKWLEPVAEQMKHPEWIGFTFWDLIFPLFMFISGVTIPYALISKAEKGVPKMTLQLKILKRALLLVIFGIIYNGTLQKGFAEVRYASVLGQIGVAYMIGASIVLHTRSLKMQAFWMLFLVALVTALHLFIPVPGYGAGHFDPERCMNAYVDQMLLPGTLSSGTYDRLGIICIVSAALLVIAGNFTGRMLRSGEMSQNRKTGIMLGTGVVFLILGIALSPWYPIIKVIWTMTFNFLTLGISLILLALFYYLIDVKQFGGRAWSKILFFFKVIGMNSITIYMAARMIPFREVSTFFTGWLIEPAGRWVMLAGVLVIEWLVLYYLYKRKIFLKV